MYDPNVFASGVHGVLLVKWKLRCETPLSIRNGIRLQYGDAGGKKERGQNLRMNWGKKEDHEVAALHYGYKIENNHVKAIHFVPGSSVRGGLRSWTIRNLVQREWLGTLTPVSKENPDDVNLYLQTLYQALDTGVNGQSLVYSLFGQIADIRANKQLQANAGRLKVQVVPFTGTQLRGIDSAGMTMNVSGGPDNVRRHMAVRSPIDRITHATKKGGLHHFLEFSRGEVFEMQLTVANPLARDVGLISVWRREINDGMLRFGALSSIGRGRLLIQEESYVLWRRKNASTLVGPEHFQKQEIHQNQDVLDGVWQSYKLPLESISEFEAELKNYMGGADYA